MGRRRRRLQEGSGGGFRVLGRRWRRLWEEGKQRRRRVLGRREAAAAATGEVAAAAAVGFGVGGSGGYGRVRQLRVAEAREDLGKLIPCRENIWCNSIVFQGVGHIIYTGYLA